MNEILKSQLILLRSSAILLSALLWNGNSIWAQTHPQNSTKTAKPRPKLTRAGAIRAFASLLETAKESEYQDYEKREIVSKAISRKSDSSLGAQTNILMLALAAQWKLPKQLVKVQSEGDKTATVIVEDDPVQVKPEFVLVEEDGSWGVDLVETYAKWNNLEGLAKSHALFNVAGVVVEDLPHDETLNRRLCQANLRKIGRALNEYVQDHESRYPPAGNWENDLKPYLKSEAVFNCPSLPNGARCGYAFNAKLSGKAWDFFASDTVFVYETTILKNNAYGTGENRAYRHNGGSNFAFAGADSNVKWLDKSKKLSFKLPPADD